MDVYTGSILIVGFDWAPRYFSICAGQVLSLNQYQALYSLLGFRYGGDQRTTFALPNLVGRAPIGMGQVSGQPTYALGDALGTLHVKLETKHLPPHAHEASFEAVSGKQEVTIPSSKGTLKLEAKVDVNAAAAPTTQLTVANGQQVYLTNASAKAGTEILRGPYTSAAPAANAKGTIPVTTDLTGSPSTPEAKVMIDTITGGKVTVKPVGEAAPIPIMPPSLVMNFVMAVQGIYPDRP